MENNVYQKRVKEFLTRELVTLSADDSMHEALELMGENRVSALPVVDKKNRCVGILSTVDLVDLARDTERDLRDLDFVDPNSKRFLVDKLAHSLSSEKVESFMSESVVTVGMETLIGKATQEMLRNHVHHLPVVDHNDCVIGIVSTMDLLCEYADAAPE